VTPSKTTGRRAYTSPPFVWGGTGDAGFSLTIIPPAAEHFHMTEKSKRGFASMDKDRQREIARQGGQSVPSEKRSFSKNAELASQAGSKGGSSVDPKNRVFSRDPKLAAAAGRKGGEASHRRDRENLGEG